MRHIMVFCLLIFVVSTVSDAQGYSVLFTKQKNGTDNLYHLSPDGQLSQVTKHRRKDSSGVLSPNGEHIAFTSERDGWWKIWTLEIRSRKFTQLTFDNQAAYAPAWSPDGEQIAYIATNDGNNEIYVISRDGKGAQNLTRSELDEATPFWAKDGFRHR